MTPLKQMGDELTTARVEHVTDLRLCGRFRGSRMAAQGPACVKTH